MGLDAELYTCHKDDLDIEKVFLYNGFIVTNPDIYSNQDDTLEEDDLNVTEYMQKAFTTYGGSLTDTLEMVNENLSRSDFYLFLQAYRDITDDTTFINGCFTVITFREMEMVFTSIKDKIEKDTWLDNLLDTIYINDSNMRYIFRADW